MYNPQLSEAIRVAISRIQSELAQAAPFLAEQVAGWMSSLAGQAQPEAYFQHPLAFPALLLPWWLEKTIHPNPDPPFQTNLVYSTINGYYFIRLIDNLMDGHATVELKLLPALSFFHTQFQTAYQPYFAADHPFWDFFSTIWFASAEATFRDAQLNDIDQTQFSQVTARKVCAGKIPLAAVCYRYEQERSIEPWGQFFDLFGCWHQLLNDLFDWRKDLERQTQTYFLAEAGRRKQPDETITVWVVQEGFAWGMATLQAWLAELKTLANRLHSPDLIAYLATREAMLLKQGDEVAAGLRNIAKILQIAGSG